MLLFFASLFVIVGGLEEAGVLSFLAEKIISGAESNLVLTAIILMWSAAILSALVDNIPFTVAMVPVITFLGAQGVDVNLLWWALLFGVGFGGNGSPIGSTANVLVISKSEKADCSITLKMWLKSGTLVMVTTLLIATVIILLFSHYLAK